MSKKTSYSSEDNSMGSREREIIQVLGASCEGRMSCCMCKKVYQLSLSGFFVMD